MRLLIQRVKQAHVSVNGRICGKIQHGLLAYLGIHKSDTPSAVDWLVKKLISLRIFRDEQGKMNWDIRHVQGELLVVSQFTLYANVARGRRPEFTEAALPQTALLLYEQFIRELTQALNRPIQTGIFGALMEVFSINDGPVTFLLER